MKSLSPRIVPNKRDVFVEDVSLPVSDDMTGMTVIVSGGGKGIGKAVSVLLAQAGARVYILTRRSGSELTKKFPTITRLDCDVAVMSDVTQAVETIVATEGRIDHIVPAAGVAQLTAIADESEAFFDTVIDTNFKGVRNLLVATLPWLKLTKGSVTMIGSLWGLPGTNLPGDATYSAADAAIIKYAEVAAVELAPVRVNCVSPALVDTHMNDDMSPAEISAFVAGYSDRETLLQPMEIAAVIAGLIASRETGRNVVIDGGYLSNIR